MIYISLSKGKIGVSATGIPCVSHIVTEHFQDEEKAADYIAALAVKTGSTSFLHSSSYNHPEENGLPNFNNERFERSVLLKFNEKIR